MTSRVSFPSRSRPSPSRATVCPSPALVAVFVSLVALVALVVAPIGESMALGPEPALAAPVDDDRPTRPTINEFYPEQRPLSDCLSSLPKPNCGSDARGGWRQLAVLGAIVGGLGFIAWRIVATARRSQPDPVA